VSSPESFEKPRGLSPVDFLAIFVAGVASITVIIVLRPGVDEPEGLTSKVQKPQEFLKSEGERLQRKIDSALAGIKIVETRPGAQRGR
jgi:hypothetical protein